MHVFRATIRLRHRLTPISFGSAAAADGMTQSVFFFGNGAAEGKRDMKSVLGGKGANLAEMTNLGVPVPPGFTIACSECIRFARWQHIRQARPSDGNLARLERHP